MFDIVLRLSILRPGEWYSCPGSPQTEAAYIALMDWRAGTVMPTWTELMALGDVELSDLRLAAIDAIDSAAGEARARYTSTGQMVTDEYRLTYDEAVAFKAAGYPAESIPESIQAWVDGSDYTVQQAADNIIATKPQLDTVLNAIRSIRLPAKHNVRSAIEADIPAIRDAAVAAINAV